MKPSSTPAGHGGTCSTTGRLLEPIGNVPPAGVRNASTFSSSASRPSRPDSNQGASGEAGTVHIDTKRICPTALGSPFLSKTVQKHGEEATCSYAANKERRSRLRS